MKKERAFVHEVHSWIRESKYKGSLENSPSFALHIVSVLLEEAMIIRGIDIWNVRKLSKNFHRFPEILKNFLRTFVDTHLLWSVAGLSDLNFVVAAGAGWDEFSKTKKEKRAMQKCADLVDFEKCLKLMISCPRSALIQPRMNSGKSDVSWRRSGFQRSRHAGRRPRAQPN